MHQIVLASQSPRRKEILSFFELPLLVAASSFKEESVPFEDGPAEYVCQLAKGKGRALAPAYPDAAIISADTIVYKNGTVFGKPGNKDEAQRMLNELSGNWHSVFTGLSLIHKEREFHSAEETRVLFNHLTPKQIGHYLEQVQWTDKAGSYGIQMGGGLLVNRIEGCYYNVMGLPVNSLRSLLLNIGIDLWEHIRKCR